MYIVKGYVFYHNKEDDMMAMKLSDMMPEPFKVNNYEEGHKCFTGAPYYMFLLSPIKEKEETE
jgi:hypothetical protein